MYTVCKVYGFVAMYGLKAIVIGAGIGGLTTGIALRQAGYEVEIYDRVRDLRPIGSGISLWSNACSLVECQRR